MSFIRQSEVDTFLEEALAVYGETVTILPYSTSATASIYRQRTKTYGAPVEVTGAVSFDLTEEVATSIGLKSVPEGAVTFARAHLESAFGTEDLSSTITAKDDIVVGGSRYRITECAESGRLEDAPTFIVVAFSSHAGREGEAYP